MPAESHSPGEGLKNSARPRVGVDTAGDEAPSARSLSHNYQFI